MFVEGKRGNYNKNPEMMMKNSKLCIRFFVLCYLFFVNCPRRWKTDVFGCKMYAPWMINGVRGRLNFALFFFQILCDFLSNEHYLIKFSGGNERTEQIDMRRNRILQKNCRTSEKLLQKIFLGKRRFDSDLLVVMAVAMVMKCCLSL